MSVGSIGSVRQIGQLDIWGKGVWINILVALDGSALKVSPVILVGPVGVVELLWKFDHVTTSRGDFHTNKGGDACRTS